MIWEICLPHRHWRLFNEADSKKGVSILRWGDFVLGMGALDGKKLFVEFRTV